MREKLSGKFLRVRFSNGPANGPVLNTTNGPNPFQRRAPRHGQTTAKLLSKLEKFSMREFDLLCFNFRISRV